MALRTTRASRTSATRRQVLNIHDRRASGGQLHAHRTQSILIRSLIRHRRTQRSQDQLLGDSVNHFLLLYAAPDAFLFLASRRSSASVAPLRAQDYHSWRVSLFPGTSLCASLVAVGGDSCVEAAFLESVLREVCASLGSAQFLLHFEL